MRQNIFLLLIASLTISWIGCTHEFEPSYPNTPMGNMDALWDIIDQRYCFVEEKGIDWDDVHTRFQRKVKLHQRHYEQSNVALFDLLAAMLNELHDGHVNLYSSWDVSRCSEWYDGYEDNFNEQLLYDQYLTNYRVAGGLQYQKIHHDSIAYIYYSSFSSSCSEVYMENALTLMGKCKGLILDVRNNGGGNLENSYLLAAPFFTDNQIVGYWQHKIGPGHSDYSEEEEMHMDIARGTWKKKVVVLCNRHSYSATNTFLSIMRYADNVVLMGGISGGGGGMPMSYELPNGWLVRFSSVKMYDCNHQSIEEGITPDIEVTLVSEDKDDIIESAIDYILHQP